MRLIMVGPQGAGKGTQGGLLAERYAIPHVATGDLLRAEVREGTAVGVKAREFMERGDLVPDDLVLEMLERRLAKPDATEGFVLDGFPRNAAQAEALDRVLARGGHGLHGVVSLEVPDDVLVERLSARRTCPTCGRPYTQVGGRPVRCDDDGTELVHRADDTPEAIRRRLAIFHEHTMPLIAFYEERDLVIHVDGVGSVDEVETRIVKELEARAS